MSKLAIIKVEELLAIVTNPDAVVLERELEEKLRKILTLLRDPAADIVEHDELIQKLETIVSLVNDAMIDIDIDVSYCIPEVETTADSCDVFAEPHIVLTYNENAYNTRTRKVSLGKTALQSTPEDLTKHVLLEIETFKEEIDNIQMG